MAVPTSLESVLAFVTEHADAKLLTLRDRKPFRIRLSDAGGVGFDRPDGAYETIKPEILEECISVFNGLSGEERRHPSNYPKKIFTSSYVASLLIAASEAEIPPAILTLKPEIKSQVYELVGHAGFDTSDWTNFKGSNPAVNPKYCYEWAFWDDSGRILLCLWYVAMRLENGEITQRLNYRDLALRSQGNRKTRAQRMDRALQMAANRKLPIRVIVIDGVRQGDDAASASKVARRALDPVPWSVAAYDRETGECGLVRGRPPTEFADQFSADEDDPPEKRLVSGESFVRNSTVRRNVLVRANGVCESCGKVGFLMGDGRVYLETHHIVPLAENGRDTEQNVIALCPNEHREAHSGAKKIELRQLFADLICKKLAQTMKCA
jgi:5-methylcytosine-specific restriction protein A